MTSTRIILLFLIASFIAAFFYFGLGDYLTLEALKSQQAGIENYRATHPILLVVFYTLLYIAMTGLSLPGASILTLAGGAIFGVFWGTVIVSFASTIGATLAFLAARFLFRESVEAKFSDRLQAINDGVKQEGGFYLFSLRLVPIFPFFMINLLMGLTTIKISTFYWVSQVGMLIGTVVYVNAGTQLARLDSLAGILSPALLASLVLLGILPIITKKIMNNIKEREFNNSRV
ncbi:MAG: hypothetical protein GQ582_12345 [Methyloprofundus sp.]|nr:hypothetical protein [Methyloprofundus sp.]